MPRTLKSFLLYAVVIAIVLFGLKIYSQQSITKYLDAQLVKATPYAEASYDHVEVDWLGNVHVHRLSVLPKHGNGVATLVNRVTLSSPHKIQFLLSVIGIIDTIPHAMSLEFQSIDAGLDASVLSDTVVAQQNERLDQLFAPVCGDVHALSATELKAMGIEHFRINMLLSYDYSLNDERLTIDNSISFFDSGELSAQVNIINVPEIKAGSASLNSLAQSMPQLASIVIDYRDKGYFSQYRNYCAKKENVVAPDFAKLEANRSDLYYAMAYGVVPSESFKRAYQQFLLNPIDARLEISPKPSFNPMMAMIEPQQLLSELGMVASLNGNLVSDFSLSLPDQELIESQLAAARSARRRELRRQERIAQGLPPEEKVEQGPRFSEANPLRITKQQLPNYKGYRLRVTSTRERELEGVFIGKDGGNIQLRVDKFGGDVVMSLSIFYTDLIEVIGLGDNDDTPDSNW